MLLLLRGDMGWDDGEDGVDVTTDQGLRESTFADLIRMMNTSTVWLHNVSEEVRVLKQLFEGHDTSPHRGRVYRAKPRLRLWQQKRAKEQQEVRRKRRVFSKASKNPYDVMKS